MTFLHREVILDSKECFALKTIILQNEKYVKELGPDIYGGRAGNDALTGRYSVYNWLNNLRFRNTLLPKLTNFFKKDCNWYCLNNWFISSFILGWKNH